MTRRVSTESIKIWTKWKMCRVHFRKMPCNFATLKFHFLVSLYKHTILPSITISRCNYHLPGQKWSDRQQIEGFFSRGEEVVSLFPPSQNILRRLSSFRIIIPRNSLPGCFREKSRKPKPEFRTRTDIQIEYSSLTWLYTTVSWFRSICSYTDRQLHVKVEGS